MEQYNQFSDLLRIVIQLQARLAFSEDRLREIVLPGKASLKQLTAYNLCDASRTLTEVARKAKVDPGNFSRTVARWVS